MVGHIRVHRAHHADVVDRLRGPGKNLAHLDPALPVFFESERRLVARARLPLRAEMLHRQRLAVKLREPRLRVEGVHMRRPAVHEKVDDALRLRREMRRFRRERIQIRHLGGAGSQRIPQHAAQRQRAHPHSAAVEKIAAGEKLIGEARSVVVLGHGEDGGDFTSWNAGQA